MSLPGISVDDATAVGCAVGLLESSHDAILTWSRDGTILTWNTGAERLYGYRADEIIGLPITRLIPPDRVGEARHILERIARGERAEPFDTVRVRKDGARIDVSMSVSPLCDGAGRIIGVAAAHRDIRDRRRLERHLAQERTLAHHARRQFRQIFESAPVGIFRSNREGRILLANQAFATMLGYASPQALAALDLDREVYVVPGERERLIAQCEPTGGAWTKEIRWKRRDGTPFWVHVVAHGVRDDTGRLAYFECFTQDVTERRRAESDRDALAHRFIEVQEAERRDLACEIHDEIGQQLTALKLIIEGGGKLGGRAAMLEILRDVSTRVQDVSHRLRPPMLDELGLLPTLRWHLRRYTRQTGVQVQFTHGGLERRFPDGVEMTAYRLVQEALTNVARHAGVTEAALDVRGGADHLSLRVADRGVGFDGQAGLPQAARGLRGMRERIRMLEGTFAIQAAPGAGVSLSARIPVAPHGDGRPA